MNFDLVNGKLKISIIGHSFVRRLSRFSNSCDLFDNLRLDSAINIIDFRAKGGLTVRKLIDCDLLTFNKSDIPDAVFLQIGGNDAADKKKHYVTIARDIVSIARYLVEGVGVKTVLIGQLLPRRVDRTFKGYNKKIISINEEIVRLINRDNNNNIQFWHNHGFWEGQHYLVKKLGAKI